MQTWGRYITEEKRREREELNNYIALGVIEG
jgi:hypothetical protein